MAQKNLKRRRASVKKKQRSSALATKRRAAEPSLSAIGEELRTIVRRLELVESCLIVVNIALDGQNVEQDGEISTVLKHVLDKLLFEHIRDLENVAAKCDGGPPSDRNEDNDDEPEDEDAVALEGAL